MSGGRVMGVGILEQNVSRIVCFVDNGDGSQSVEDILELPCSVSEAPHYYDRYWGQHRVHEGVRRLEAGYTVAGAVVWPFTMCRRAQVAA
jgi:hypothetical protein